MELMRYTTDEGERVALLVAEGRKWLKVVLMGDTCLRKVKATEKKYMSQMDYPLPRARRKFAHCTKAFNGNTVRGLSKPLRAALGI